MRDKRLGGWLHMQTDSYSVSPGFCGHMRHHKPTSQVRKIRSPAYFPPLHEISLTCNLAGEMTETAPTASMLPQESWPSLVRWDCRGEIPFCAGCAIIHWWRACCQAGPKAARHFDLQWLFCQIYSCKLERNRHK